MTPSTSWWFIHVLCWRKTLDDTQINNLSMSTTWWSFITNAQMWRQRTNEFQLNCILISSGVTFLSFLHSQARHSPAASLKPEDVTVFVWNETKETESAPGLLLSHIHSAIKWTPTRHCRRTEGPHLYSAAATTSRLQFRCVCVCVFEEPFHPLMANYLLGTPRPGEEKENELKN